MNRNPVRRPGPPHEINNGCCSTAGITWRIGLRFNNPSAQADIPKIADKSFADQKSRELDGAGGQLCPA